MKVTECIDQDSFCLVENKNTPTVFLVVRLDFSPSKIVVMGVTLNCIEW